MQQSITFCVCDEKISVPRALLDSLAPSPLHLVASGLYKDTNEVGHVVLDRDPVAFRLLIDLLLRGELPASADPDRHVGQSARSRAEALQQALLHELDYSSFARTLRGLRGFGVPTGCLVLSGAGWDPRCASAAVGAVPVLPAAAAAVGAVHPQLTRHTYWLQPRYAPMTPLLPLQHKCTLVGEGYCDRIPYVGVRWLPDKEVYAAVLPLTPLTVTGAGAGAGAGVADARASRPAHMHVSYEDMLARQQEALVSLHSGGADASAPAATAATTAETALPPPPASASIASTAATGSERLIGYYRTAVGAAKAYDATVAILEAELGGIATFPRNFVQDAPEPALVSVAVAAERAATAEAVTETAEVAPLLLQPELGTYTIHAGTLHAVASLLVGVWGWLPDSSPHLPATTTRGERAEGDGNSAGDFHLPATSAQLVKLPSSYVKPGLPLWYTDDPAPTAPAAAAAVSGSGIIISNWWKRHEFVPRRPFRLPSLLQQAAAAAVTGVMCKDHKILILQCVLQREDYLLRVVSSTTTAAAAAPADADRQEQSAHQQQLVQRMRLPHSSLHTAHLPCWPAPRPAVLLVHLIPPPSTFRSQLLPPAASLLGMKVQVQIHAQLTVMGDGASGRAHHIFDLPSHGSGPGGPGVPVWMTTVFGSSFNITVTPRINISIKQGTGPAAAVPASTFGGDTAGEDCDSLQHLPPAVRLAAAEAACEALALCRITVLCCCLAQGISNLPEVLRHNVLLSEVSAVPP